MGLASRPTCMPLLGMLRLCNLDQMKMLYITGRLFVLPRAVLSISLPLSLFHMMNNRFGQVSIHFTLQVALRILKCLT